MGDEARRRAADEAQNEAETNASTKAQQGRWMANLRVFAAEFAEEARRSRLPFDDERLFGGSWKVWVTTGDGQVHVGSTTDSDWVRVNRNGSIEEKLFLYMDSSRDVLRECFVRDLADRMKRARPR